jgi:hypothetical protein
MYVQFVTKGLFVYYDKKDICPSKSTGINFLYKFLSFLCISISLREFVISWKCPERWSFHFRNLTLFFLLIYIECRGKFLFLGSKFLSAQLLNFNCPKMCSTFSELITSRKISFWSRSEWYHFWCYVLCLFLNCWR